MPCLTSSTAGAWVPPATSGLLLGGMPAIAPATPYDEDDPRTWPFEWFMQHQRAIAAREAAYLRVRHERELDAALTDF